MGQIRDMGDFMAEEEARLLAKARAEIAAEQADPAFQAEVLRKMAEREAESEPAETADPEADEDDYDDDEGEEK